MRLRFLLALLAASVASPAVAQRVPDASAVVDAWTADWRRASAGIESIESRERLERQVEGPRGRTAVVVDGRVRYRAGERPDRRPDRVVLDGREVDPRRSSQHSRRMGRAFGRAGQEVARPPLLPGDFIPRSQATAIRADRVGGQDAWRVSLRTDWDGLGLTAWFTRSAQAPRLLRVHAEATSEQDGRFAREVDYARVRGLDLPREVRSSVTVRQQRRLREYVVTFTAVGRYSDYRLVGR